MIDMLKRHEIQVLRRAGHTLEEVPKPVNTLDLSTSQLMTGG